MQTTNSRILLTCILKDDSEIAEAKRMLTSFVMHVDGFVCALTGISGQFSELKALITGLGGKYVECDPITHPKLYAANNDGVFFANFAEARNVVWRFADEVNAQEKVPYDFYTWADADDVLVGGEKLHEIADQAKTADLDQVFFTYWYAVDLNEQGQITQVLIEHLRERLIKPGTAHWISRLHEVLVSNEDAYQPRMSFYGYDPKAGQATVWVHLSQADRFKAALSRNVKILQIQAREEDFKDPRTVFYLAKTLYDSKDPQYEAETERLLQSYLLGQHQSGWAEERSCAREYLANLKGRHGDHAGAAEILHEAIKEYPARQMIYLLLAKEYSELQKFDEADFWTAVAGTLPPPTARTTIGNPAETKWLYASLKYNESMRKQDFKEALVWAKVRNQIGAGSDQEMVDALEWGEELNDAAHHVFSYAKWLKDKGYIKNILPLLDSLPLELGREAFAAHIANEVKEPKVWGNKEICFYASWGAEHMEQWSPTSLKHGIGGSETAVIQLAKRWAQHGWHVTVYGDPRDEAGVFDGVEYKPYYQINWNDTFNILILWRSPHLLDRDIKAKQIFMDLHDITSQLDWRQSRMDKIDKVFFKSKWHRGQVPLLPDGKAVVIPNGIDTTA